MRAPERCRCLQQLRLLADDGVGGLVAHQASDRERETREDPPVRDHTLPAAAIGECSGGESHVLIVVADDGEVVGIVPDRRGDRAASEAEPGDEAEPDVARPAMTLDDRELEQVGLRVCDEAAAIHSWRADERLGDELVGVHADDADARRHAIRTDLETFRPEALGEADRRSRRVLRRLAPAEVLAVLRDKFPAEPGLLDVHGITVAEDEDVGEATGCDGAEIRAPVVLGDVQTADAKGQFGAEAEGDRPTNDVVYVPVLTQVAGVPVIGAEADPMGVLSGDQTDQRIEVARGRAFPDEYPLAQRQLFLGLLKRSALVVGRDAGGNVRLQRRPGETRGVAVDDATVEAERDLRQDSRVGVDHAREVHHLGEGDDVWCQIRIVEQLTQIVCDEFRAGGLEGCRRHARRDGPQRVERDASGIVHEPADTLRTEHIGDLVRVEDRAGRPVRRGESDKLRRGEHGGLDVHVGVEEPGNQPAIGTIDGLTGLNRSGFVDASDPPPFDTDVPPQELASKYVEDESANEGGVARRVPTAARQQLGAGSLESGLGWRGHQDLRRREVRRERVCVVWGSIASRPARTRGVVSCPAGGELRMVPLGVDIFGARKALLGMVHVGALPGSPRAGGRSVAEIAQQAAEEAELLVSAGFDGVIIENMHDTPYLKREVGPEIVASMTAVGVKVRDAIGSDAALGVQILAGANRAALAVAHAIGAGFIRAEGFVYSAIADEGLLDTADAGPLLRYRRMIGAEDVRILCDIKKKHSSHAITADVDLAETARAAEFFRADGVIVTGTATGRPTKVDDVRAVRTATKLPLAIGSGTTPANIRETFEYADAVIVGSWYKQDGDWQNPPDEKRVRELVDAANRARL